MEQPPVPSNTEKKFRGKLSLKILLLLAPVAILPLLLWSLLSTFDLAVQFKIGILIVTLLVLGFLGWLAAKNMVQSLQEITQSIRQLAEGYLHKRSAEQRDDEIGLLAHSLNLMADKLSARFQALETKIETRTKHIHAVAEIAQSALSDADIQPLLQRTVDLIVERFHHYHAAIYLIDEDTSQLTLQAAYGAPDPKNIDPETVSSADAPSIPEWVAANNRPWIASDVSKDQYYVPTPNLANTKSEAGIPISIGDDVIGVLDVQSTNINAFNDNDILTLQILAQQIAAALQKNRSGELPQANPQATTLLLRASHAIVVADDQDKVLQALENSIQHTPCVSALFLAEQNILKAIWADNEEGAHDPDSLDPVPYDPFEFGEVFSEVSPILVRGRVPGNIPQAVGDLAAQLKYHTFALYPLLVSGNLMGLLFLGATDQERLGSASIEIYTSLVEMTVTALEKIYAVESINQRLTELQTISTISQSISTETSLTQLYEIIHHQILQVIGEVNFFMALYEAETNLIEIPYMDEGSATASIPPFPLGQGLTSIVVRTRQPLMIVEDTVNRSRALGAVILGNKPAKSWLGVPLLTGGEVIGAIVVQDTEDEGRFDEEDLRLLTTLAAQVAAAIRNTRLLEDTRSRATRDRQLYEITSKIRQATDMRSVLAITAQELGKALGVRRAEIKISVEKRPQAIGGNGHHPEEEIAP